MHSFSCIIASIPYTARAQCHQKYSRNTNISYWPACLPPWWLLTNLPHWTSAFPYLSCFSANSSIFILRMRSCIRFSWPFLSPWRKAILALETQLNNNMTLYSYSPTYHFVWNIQEHGTYTTKPEQSTESLPQVTHLKVTLGHFIVSLTQFL